MTDRKRFCPCCAKMVPTTRDGRGAVRLCTHGPPGKPCPGSGTAGALYRPQKLQR